MVYDAYLDMRFWRNVILPDRLMDRVKQYGILFYGFWSKPYLPDDG